jgi:Domain of unknown function (DUF4833)
MAVPLTSLNASAEGRTTLLTLFDISRNKNANIVRYAARCRGQALDATRPIDAKWLMLAEDGRREELSWGERRLAYGFAVSNLSSSGCRLRLLACEARPILVERYGQTFRALASIAGRRAVLEGIFVQAKEGTLLPSVEYIDLHGRDSQGAPLHERLFNR